MRLPGRRPFFAVSSNSRTTGFEPVDGGASPPAAAKAVFGSQALTVKPPVLTRQNPEHYRGGPPVGSVAQQSAQLPHKEKVAGASPARAPNFEAWQSSKCSAL